MNHEYNAFASKQLQTGAGYASPQSIPEVLSQVASLTPNISHVVDLTARLESRLSESVLRGAIPETSSEKSARLSASTQLGSKLQDANDALVALACRLTGIIDRLEV